MTLVEQPARRPTPSLLDSSVRLGYERRIEAKSRVEEGPGPSTARELQAVLHAAREGAPFLVYRDPAGAQRIVRFGSERSELTLGRNPTADLSIGWDDQVSALHAVIDRLAGELTLRDDGLSRNGSYLNGERVHGIRRLRDGDMLRLGRTLVLIRNPADAGRSATAAVPQPLQAAKLSEQQRKVLSVLCRPLNDTNELATLPTNQEIADELYLSVAAVKLHLRALFDKFGDRTPAAEQETPCARPTGSPKRAAQRPRSDRKSNTPRRRSLARRSRDGTGTPRPSDARQATSIDPVHARIGLSGIAPHASV